MVHDVLNSRRNDIRQQLQADSHSISHSVLTDFDWKLKVILTPFSPRFIRFFQSKVVVLFLLNKMHVVMHI